MWITRLTRRFVRLAIAAGVVATPTTAVTAGVIFRLTLATTPPTDGYFEIVSRNSDVRHSGKAMDVEFGSTDDGAAVIQYTPHGGANQQWLLRPVESAAAASTTTVSER